MLGILSFLLLLCLAISWWGQIIYGGIWWGRLRKGPENAGGRAFQFWQTTLAMWVCSLVLPFLAPWICACILASWTTSDGCAKFQADLFKGAEGQQEVKEWLTRCGLEHPGTAEDVAAGCRDWICSGQPHKLMLAWSIMGGIGLIAGLFVNCAKRLLKK